MYHLLRGLHEYLTRKDEYSIVIIGLDNVSRSFQGDRVLIRVVGGQDSESLAAGGRGGLTAR
jgi:hypothetical protein